MSLLDYQCYEDYLDHFVSVKDRRYLGSWSLSRQFIQNACGRSCMGRLLSRDEFAEERRKQEIMLNPRCISTSKLFGEAYNGDDPVLQQFAMREEKLLNKQISTIIFLIMRSVKGFDVSAFIDLEQSLRQSRFKNSDQYVNWRAIFEGKAKLMPRPIHLSYYDWNSNRVRSNDSDNFRNISHSTHSLLMMHRGDHKLICVNAGCHCPFKKNAARSVYNSSIYGQCLFYDHNIRRIS